MKNKMFSEPEVNLQKREYMVSIIKNAFNYATTEDQIEHLILLRSKYKDPTIAISKAEVREDLLYLEEIFD